MVALCAAGMEREGDASAARLLFEQAWAARQDDFDAAIAAHYVARHQPTRAETLHWNEVALRHAELVTDGRATPMMASLYLNFGDALARVGRDDDARAAAGRALTSLEAIPTGGYRDWLAHGIRRLQERLAPAQDPTPGERP